jgi:hypothetical protein
MDNEAHARVLFIVRFSLLWLQTSYKNPQNNVCGMKTLCRYFCYILSGIFAFLWVVCVCMWGGREGSNQFCLGYFYLTP